MGNHAAKQNLDEALKRAETRVGKVAVTGRYHRTPKRLADDYIVEQKVLGTGYNGQVYMARGRNNSSKYAVKGFRLHGINREKREELVSECEIFLAMDFPHVARLVDVYESEDKLDLVMECMAGGELFSRVQSRKRFKENDAAVAVQQVLLAINYLHKHDVVHRDIKLENFLYESADSDHLKLIDFGFSKVWQPDTRMALSCGTLSYVAPEVLKKNYTSQCDLWSVGVLTFILLSGYMPFSGDECNQIKKIEAGQFDWKEVRWKTVSNVARDFVKGLLVVDPVKRMTAEQALGHGFITDVSRKEGEGLNAETVSALAQFGQASAFRRACMCVMAWSLSNDERKDVRQAFLDMDPGRTGVVSLCVFKEVLEQRFHIHDKQAVEIFEALDQNHTDEIHYSEFLAAMCSTRIKLHDNLLKATFNRFDTDKTGYISVTNLKDVLGDKFDTKEVEKMIEEADIKKDGKISYDEFMEYLRHPEAASHHIDAAAILVDSTVTKAHAYRDSEESELSVSKDVSKGMMPKLGEVSCRGMSSKRVCSSFDGPGSQRSDDAVNTDGVKVVLEGEQRQPNTTTSRDDKTTAVKCTCNLL